MFRRHVEMTLAGQPHDPGDPRSMAESPEQLAERIFKQQDLEAARLERQAMLEAGLTHRLNLRADEVDPTGPARCAEPAGHPGRT
jgi:hypothetical protein